MTTEEEPIIDTSEAPAPAPAPQEDSFRSVGEDDVDDHALLVQEVVQLGVPEKERPAIQRVRVHHRESVRSLVESKPALRFSFENLTVQVPARQAKCAASWFRPCQQYAQDYLGVPVNKQDAFTCLQNVSGHVQTGELLLVMSGNQLTTSTLIQAVTGRLVAGLDRLTCEGSIRVNGCPILSSSSSSSEEPDAADLQGWRRIAAHVSPDDTTHAAVLTVRETLEFAARCSVSKPGNKTERAVRELTDEILEALDLTHVADTVVGDENLRGVSGGQKRRVTVGEMVMGDVTSFYGLEKITDGLSSQDSFKLVTQLAEACRSLRMAAMVSLSQPSDEIVQLFDRIMVLSDDGQLVYFGPPHRGALRQVFLGPSDQQAASAADSGSICDLVLTHATEEARERFSESAAHKEMVDSLEEIRALAPGDARTAIRDLFPDSKYGSNWLEQFRFIGGRRFKLIARNAVTYTRVIIACVFGLIIGSLFSELGYNIFGSLARTGYLFLHCFLVLMLSAAITIPAAFRERVTLFKHRSAEFFSGRVAYVTQVLYDIPLSIVEACLLASISYFWVGLEPAAQNFFYFLGTLIGLEFVGQAFGRLLCAVSRKQVYANSWSSVLLIIFGTVAGFMPSYSAIPWVLRWMSWLTPASYAFEGIMINEFVGRQLTGISIPSEDGGTTQLGSFAGEDWLETTGLPRRNWTSLQGIKIFDIFFLFILALVFDFLGCYLVEQSRHWYFNPIRRPQQIAKSTMTFGKATSSDKHVESKEGDNADWPQSLAIKDLSYYVPSPKVKVKVRRCSVHAILEPLLVRCFGKHKGKSDPVVEKEGSNELQLLTTISGRFARGRITALMGTSGAGKTTLLDVIAGYKTGGRITGDILIDGRPKETASWKNISGYAEQNDILNPYLSVMETLRFTAACRLPNDVDREQVIENVINLIGLEDWTDMVVGREMEGEGLPKHARKRLTIAVQLVCLPKILFADEPTTGLSTTAANTVMQALRRCTDEMNLITITTIHQPSKLIWDEFDDLLLLVKGGKTAYMGEVGRESQSVIEYFQTLSGIAPGPQVNPADYVLSAVNSVSIEDAATAFQNSKSITDTVESIESDISAEKKSRRSQAAMEKVGTEARRGKSFCREYLLLTRRHLTTQWRNPTYAMMRLLASCFVSLYMGILFFGKKDNIDGAVFSIGAIFFLVFVLVIPMQATVVPLIEDRAVLYRETSSGLYSRISYALGQLTADVLPFHALNALVMFVAFYFLVDFRVDGGLIGYFIFVIFLSNWVIMSLGQLYALATPNEESANGLAGLSVILSVILMGFLITVNAMPSYWEWAYWANLFRYIIQGLVTNELANNEYTLLPPTPLNVSNAFMFDPGVQVDNSNASTATQSANFVNLAIHAGPNPDQGYDWENSGIVGLTALLNCMVENECLVDPIAVNFVRCTIVDFPGSPVCKDGFDNAMENVDIEGVLGCFGNVPKGNSTETTTDSSLPSYVPRNFTLEQFQEMEQPDQLETVLCLLAVLLPPGLIVDIINEILPIVDTLFEIAMFVIDIVEEGIKLPGEVILWVFGWAEWQDGELVAPWKWNYCVIALVVFIASIEILKLFSIRLIVWTKR